MRIGIYNRWLATLGGGEKYSLAVAEYLARRHSVSVITHQPVSKDLAMQRLHLDLSKVDFVVVPDRPTSDLVALTTQYDFFINASFQDMFSSLASRSALLIYFPTPLATERAKQFQRRGGLVLHRLLMIPTFWGALDTQAWHGTQIRYCGRELRIRLPASRFDYAVSFDLACPAKRSSAAMVLLDGEPKARIDLRHFPEFAHYETGVRAAHPRFHELTIRLEGAEENADSPIRLVVAGFQIARFPYRVYRLVFERWLKNWGVRLHRAPTQTSDFLECIDSYREIWAISEFTRGWIHRYWNRPSLLLFPPVDVERLAPAAKRRQILTVGRFFAESHNKKHGAMIGAFKEMVDAGLEGWEFHLAGGTRPGEMHEKYLNQLVKDAQGYPIVIHPDISYEDLVALYQESSIYWHAAGLGEDADREPIKFEHFGITTVEAMAAGCVPVVIGKGGQPEIVKHGENGFLWNTTRELKELSRRLMLDAPLWTRLSRAAVRDSQFYDRPHFEMRLQKIVETIGIE